MDGSKWCRWNGTSACVDRYNGFSFYWMGRWIYWSGGQHAHSLSSMEWTMWSFDPPPTPSMSTEYWSHPSHIICVFFIVMFFVFFKDGFLQQLCKSGRSSSRRTPQISWYAPSTKCSWTAHIPSPPVLWVHILLFVVHLQRHATAFMCRQFNQVVGRTDIIVFIPCWKPYTSTTGGLTWVSRCD